MEMIAKFDLIVLQFHFIYCLQQNYYIQSDSSNLGFEKYYAVLNVSSIIRCAAKCSYDQACIIESFVQRDKQCALINVTDNSVIYSAVSVVLRRNLPGMKLIINS